MSNKKLYVADNEFDGAYVGTLEQIEEWMQEKGGYLWSTKFYEVGAKVDIGLGVKDETS